MIVEGMPWQILLPVAALFLFWGVQTAKKELKQVNKLAKKANKK